MTGASVNLECSLRPGARGPAGRFPLRGGRLWATCLFLDPAVDSSLDSFIPSRNPLLPGPVLWPSLGWDHFVTFSFVLLFALSPSEDWEPHAAQHGHDESCA